MARRLWFGYESDELVAFQDAQRTVQLLCRPEPSPRTTEGVPLREARLLTPPNPGQNHLGVFPAFVLPHQLESGLRVWNQVPLHGDGARHRLTRNGFRDGRLDQVEEARDASNGPRELRSPICYGMELPFLAQLRLQPVSEGQERGQRGIIQMECVWRRTAVVAL